MRAYVGIDVHRRRSRFAVMDEGGRTAVNRNVPNGRETVLGVIGDLPVGTPVAFEATFGWGWLIELLQDYGFEPHLAHPLQCQAIASARLKNDKADAAPWLTGCGRICCPRRGSPRAYAACFEQIAHRRGRKIATIAVARKLLTHAYHVLRELDAARQPKEPCTTA
ncbi:transposase [Streptomyces canus]|jgi:hypothetical protein|uniref:IS110 family transposase n=1 Tax=Streptomyces canus TaxID=58343 RepID=UPI0036EFD61B